MLSLEYLLEEAESMELPTLKMRGILREYLQVIILNSIYKNNLGRSVFFMGGTALRFFYKMPRFSEDLDFDTATLTSKEFESILESVERGLRNEGFSLKVSYEKRDNLFVAEIYFPDLMKAYNITDRRSAGLMIKIEIYKPKWELQIEQGALNIYGYSLSSVLLGKENMISEKLAALFNRKRGRDIYDILYMLKKRFPFNNKVLAANKITGSPKKLIMEYLTRFQDKELKKLAEQVRPFLFKEDDVELILRAPLYAEKLLEEYE